MGTYKFSNPEKITSALDKRVSWGVLRKQFYYFTVFARNFPTETCSVGLALILPVNESLAGSVPLLITPNFKKSSGHCLKTFIMEISTHDRK